MPRRIMGPDTGLFSSPVPSLFRSLRPTEIMIKLEPCNLPDKRCHHQTQKSGAAALSVDVPLSAKLEPATLRDPQCP